MAKLPLAILLTIFVATKARPDFKSNLVQTMSMSFTSSNTYRLSYAPYQDAFNMFQAKHNKNYQNKFEENQRFAVFLSNVKYIEEHNRKFHKGEVSFFMAVNQFSDMTHDEYLRHNRLGKYSTGNRMNRIYPTCDSLFPSNEAVPEKMDWRVKGAVTPVKNQGACGSCWAFSTTGSTEGQNFLKTGTLLSFSEQQIVDCCHGKFCNGCSGGVMNAAFAYINHTGGLELESDYPYMAETDSCKFKKSEVKVRITGCTDVTPGDENAMKTAAGLKGPISIAIDAAHPSFQSYGGGVYMEPGCMNTEDALDHAVLIVGYGSENGNDFWLVKNSWGTGWGMKGYINMARNHDNMCGVATMGSYPQVAKP